MDSEQTKPNEIEFSAVLRLTTEDANCFSISTENRKLMLQCKDEAERDTWMKSLENLIFLHGRPPGAHGAEQVIEAIVRGRCLFSSLLN